MGNVGESNNNFNNNFFERSKPEYRITGHKRWNNSAGNHIFSAFLSFFKLSSLYNFKFLYFICCN
jgi:hypothetical protein